ncbi:MAG: hypothetical protein ACJAQ6_001713, partial [Arenicella sp.]
MKPVFFTFTLLLSLLVFQTNSSAAIEVVQFDSDAQ